MTSRRALVFGAASLGAAGLAYRLHPRRTLNLLGERKMADVIPSTFGNWVASADNALVKPQTEGTLAAKLYNELVGRLYTNQETGEQVMMLVAYGSTQSDLLQLHRPEACYPAVGFRLALSRPTEILLKRNVAITGRRVVAELAERQETIIYWTRLGEYLPVSPGDQRKARLLSAMQGYVPDGGLFRFSMADRAPAEAFASLDRFIAEMVMHVSRSDRSALVGERLAGALA